MKPVQNKKIIIFEFLRYCIVGGIAFLVDMGVLMFFTEIFHLDPKISAVFGFICGLIVNYILSKVFVFKKTVNKQAQAFIIFAVIGVIGLGITELCMYLGVDVMHIDYRLVKIAATGLVLIYNYTARKLLVFNKEF